MAPNHVQVVGVKTAWGEWFALSVDTAASGASDVGVEAGIGRSEDELRMQLRYLGFSDRDIDARIRQARQWMPSLSMRAAWWN